MSLHCLKEQQPLLVVRYDGTGVALSREPGGGISTRGSFWFRCQSRRPGRLMVFLTAALLWFPQHQTSEGRPPTEDQLEQRGGGLAGLVSPVEGVTE